MSGSYTFNLGMLFRKAGAVSIIVCHSESPIDHQHVNTVASERLRLGMAAQKDVHDLIRFILTGIKQKCNVDAVVVNADTICEIF